MSATLALLVPCFVLGMLARRLLRFPDATATVLNRVVLELALPALVLKTAHALQLSASLLVASSGMWLVFAGAVALFSLFERRGLPRASAAALVLTAGLGNTAFLGLPLLEALRGQAALGPAVVVDQVGSFLVLSTWGLWTAARAGGQDVTRGMLVRRVLLFPPFLALILGLLLKPVTYPAPVLVLLTRLGDMVTPLALLSVGFQLELGQLRGRLGVVAAGLAYKLLVAALLVAGVLRLCGLRGLTYDVAVLQAGMAPMVTGGILAAQYELDAPLASLMLGVGIPLSFVTVPLLAEVLRRLGA